MPLQSWLTEQQKHRHVLPPQLAWKGKYQLETRKDITVTKLIILTTFPEHSWDHNYGLESEKHSPWKLHQLWSLSEFHTCKNYVHLCISCPKVFSHTEHHQWLKQKTNNLTSTKSLKNMFNFTRMTPHFILQRKVFCHFH